jgi:hypothetical protein
MIYFCSQQKRRSLVLQQTSLNGIDYLEVCEDGDCGCGNKLLVTFLHSATNLNLTLDQIRITSGSDVQVHLLDVVPASASAPRIVGVELKNTGDFSAYTFSLIANPDTSDPPDGIDPQLSSVDFSFKAGCDTAGDCAPSNCCPPSHAAPPDINYLAKEFDGFVQVMLDRLAVLVPGWTETHPPDIGVTLVEALAYAADHLSYQQDAVGTESYIGTARSRISMRRHAKLVDYALDEGANARTWVYIEAGKDGDGVTIDRDMRFYPRVPGLPTAIDADSKQFARLNPALTFEALEKVTLHQLHDELHFYTWSDEQCCLAPGSTQATLAGHFPDLQAGSVLIFEERTGPLTGDPDDANPAARWAVRLTQVQQTDYKIRPLIDPLTGAAITRIRWDAADAPPFPLCLSSITDAAHGSKAITNVSVAMGNIVAADHGCQGGWEDLAPIPAAAPAPVASSSCSCGGSAPVDPPRVRYFPQLANSPLTFGVPFDAKQPASMFLAPSQPAKPELKVRDDQKNCWTVLPDLLSSHENSRAVVPEIERDSTVFLRFGDGSNGMSADTASSFQARYRTGSGTAGNIGHDTLAHAVTKASFRQVRNPLAARGGRDPETMEHIKQFAPFAFRSQLRAVTEDDYGAMTQLDPAIRQARGTLRWTGSWHTAFVSIAPTVGDRASADLVAATKKQLNLIRMMGVDLDSESAVIVGLRIEMNICVDPDHFQSDVRDAIMRLFTIGNLCTGQPGILNPENFTFGQTIYASPLIAVAQEVDGVSSAVLTVFQPMDDPSFDGAARGYLTMQRIQIARCDNDPNRLDHGIFLLHMDGGK